MEPAVDSAGEAVIVGGPNSSLPEAPTSESALEEKEVAEGDQTESAVRISDEVANDPEYQRSFGESYANAAKSGQVDLAVVREQALSDYYDKTAKSQVENGIPDEIKNDPQFNQTLGEVFQEAQSKNEILNGKDLQEKALRSFLRNRSGKGISKEKGANEEEELLKRELSAVKEEQKKTKEELKTMKEQVEKMVNEIRQLKGLMEKTVKYMAEGDSDRKKHLLAEILKIAGTVLASTLIQTASEVSPTKAI